MLTNEMKSKLIIQQIASRKNLDLRARASNIEAELRGGAASDHSVVLQHFNILIDIHHAKLHGLGSSHHADRDGGWGFADCDNRFLSSLREQYLSNVYGVRVGCFGGGYIPRPLSVKQVAALARTLARPFYTLQLALVERD